MIYWIIFLLWWLVAFIPIVYVDGKRFLKNYSGLTLAPFVFYKNKWVLSDDAFIRHERAHILQQRICSPPVFLIIYGINYLINRSLGMDHYKAYYNIIFEKLARQAEKE